MTGDPTGDVDCIALFLDARHDEDKAVSMRGCVEVINDVSTKGASNALIFTGLAHYKV